MKLFSLLLAFAASVSSETTNNANRKLQTAFCPNGGCCTLNGFESFDFQDIELCNQKFILQRVESVINATIEEGDTCTNNRIQEAKKVTGAATKADAIAILKTICEERIEPCVESEDDLEFEFITKCDGANILKELKKESSCDRGAKLEAQLLTKTNTWVAARTALITSCEARIDGCVISKDEPLEIAACDYTQIRQIIQEGVGACGRTVTGELKFLTGTTSLADAKAAIDAMCADQWNTIKKTQFSDITSGLSGNDARFKFTPTFMNEYRRGGGPLNTETGPVSGTNVGTAIENFEEDGATNTLLQAYDSTDDLANCKFNSMMCCFGRDRQVDDDGNCAEDDCEDADPGDNTDLCFTSKGKPYPNESEGAVHCHGLAWGTDVNDSSRQLAFNNLFFVSLYDHLSQRGYVQRSVRRDEGNRNNFPMCGCIEQMPPVTRSDCTQVDMADDVTFTISFDGSKLSAKAPANFQVEFNSCQGTTNNNDLYAHLDSLKEQGRVQNKAMNKAALKLVGKGEDNNNDDAASNASCEAAYETRFQIDYQTNA